MVNWLPVPIYIAFLNDTFGNYNRSEIAKHDYWMNLIFNMTTRVLQSMVHLKLCPFVLVVWRSIQYFAFFTEGGWCDGYHGRERSQDHGSLDCKIGVDHGSDTVEPLEITIHETLIYVLYFLWGTIKKKIIYGLHKINQSFITSYPTLA